jgi:hypothetical protein
MTQMWWEFRDETLKTISRALEHCNFWHVLRTHRSFVPLLIELHDQAVCVWDDARRVKRATLKSKFLLHFALVNSDYVFILALAVSPLVLFIVVCRFLLLIVWCAAEAHFIALAWTWHIFPSRRAEQKSWTKIALWLCKMCRKKSHDHKCRL